jgi:signal peptidase I
LVFLLVFFLSYGRVQNRWYHVLSVTSGSMVPVIHAGDVIVVSPPNTQLRPGMIITLSVNGGLVTHRVVAVNPDGSITTKGDANTTPDEWGNSKVEIRGIYRGRIPLLGYLAALPNGMEDASLTGAWFTDSDQIAGELGTTGWPSPTPSPTSTTSQLSGKLTVIPFYDHEQDRFGVDISLCLKNAGPTRITLLQILNTVQGSTDEGSFSDLLSEYLDISAKPYLDPGEEHCYTAHFIFGALKNGHYRNEIHVFAENKSDQPWGKLQAQALSDPAVDPTIEPSVLDLVAEFSLPEVIDPSPTPSVTSTPTATGTITETPTALWSETPTITPTSTATGIPFEASPYPTYTEVVDPATPYPTYTDVPASPTLLPTDTPEPAPTETPPPPAPTDAPTPEPTAAEITPTAG